jgi:PTS system cellobiose-specific IIA component
MDETQVMNLIVYAGNARSLVMEALVKAKTGDFDGAQMKQKEAAEAMGEAHKLQTSILEESLDRPEAATSLLMVHAQDHLMNAITVLELARELCELYQCIKPNRN